ncbi:MAG: iron-containing alcohol dehydrogenase, partial [Planctomycetes bacterium]|nr:iron-containing alcohol dehydrogenase [Planctomycetota bacterium]
TTRCTPLYRHQSRKSTTAGKGRPTVELMGLVFGRGSGNLSRSGGVSRLREPTLVSAAEYAKVAYCFNINTFGMSPSAAADKAIEAIAALRKRIGIPKSLAEVGVREDQLPLLAKKAFEDPCHQTNPRPCTERDLLGLYRQAYNQ